MLAPAEKTGFGLQRIGDQLLRGCAAIARRRPWAVLAVTLVMCVLAGVAATGLKVNTAADDVLAADLPFRQIERVYRQAFPRESEQVVVVIDAATPDRAEVAAARLAESLGGRPDVFQNAEVAGATEFFRRYALLFSNVEELRRLSQRLGSARPALNTLGQDPSLRGVASLLGLVQTGAGGRTIPPEIPRLLNTMAETVEARAAGEAVTMPWAQTFGFGPDARGPRRLVLLRPILDNLSVERAEPALDAIRTEIAALQRTEAGRGVTMRITGDPALRQQELNSAFSGALTASILSFVLVTLSLVLGIRSWRIIAALLVTLVVGSVLTTGLAAVAVGQLNLISGAFLVLFFGLGVDFGTHLGLRYLEDARAGTPPGEAITRMTVSEGPAVSLSALCAALGFLSFVPTDYLGLAELGIISALGMGVALVVSLTVQPALMVLMPPRPKPSADRSIGLGRWIERNYRLILVTALVATVGAAALLPRASLDVNPLNIQDPEAESVRTYRDLASNPETSPYALNVIAPNLEAARALAPRLAAIEGVHGVRTIESFVPENQAEKLPLVAAAAERVGSALNPTPRPAPDDGERRQAFTAMRNTVASIAESVPALAEPAGRLSSAFNRFAGQRGLEPAALQDLEAALVGGFPPLLAQMRDMLSAREPATAETLPEALRRDWVAADGRARLQVLPARDIGATEDLAAFASRVQAVAPNATGVAVSVTEAGNVVLTAFAQAILYTTIAIALVIALLRRRVFDVLMILAPLAVASIWTVAAAAALDLPFNFANVIVIPLLIGLGVASSVHVVVRDHEIEEEALGDTRSGSRVLETSTPLAVLVSQLNTVAAFATLAVSPHRGLYSMGVLLGLAILFVLIASLIVLPSLMVALERRRSTKASALG